MRLEEKEGRKERGGRRGEEGEGRKETRGRRGEGKMERGGRRGEEVGRMDNRNEAERKRHIVVCHN